jgi:hypothetical protein
MQMSTELDMLPTKTNDRQLGLTVWTVHAIHLSSGTTTSLMRPESQ